MEIVGRGFLARHLARISSRRHRDAVAFAAGVSSTRDVSTDSSQRETHLLQTTLQRCRDTDRTLVFFSTASAAVYGSGRPGAETDPAIANSPYGAHKLALERRVVESGADFLVLRMSHLVGADQRPHQLFPTLVSAALSGRVELQQQATRDVLGVDDAVTLVDELLARDVRNRIVNVASGHSVDVEDVVDWLSRRLGVRPQIVRRNTGSRHLVSIERLAGIVPLPEFVNFGPLYYRSALDAALGTVAG
jgi:nucleoside-diphosphate-sugar epimerase